MLFHINIVITSYSIHYTKLYEDHTIAFDISNPDYPHGFIEVVTTFSNVGLKEITSIPTEKIGLKFEINAIEPQYAFGKFGSASIDQEPIDQKFSLFEDLEWDHTIEFDDYKIRLETVNPYGVSFETSFDNITFVNEETGTSGQLIITDPNPEFTIHPATWGIPIIPRISNNTLSKANSNIAALVITSYSIHYTKLYDGVSFIFGSQTIEEQAKMIKKVKQYKAGFVVSHANLTPENTLADVIALKLKTGFSTVGITHDGTPNGRNNFV